MQAKLTLRLDEDLIGRAKSYSRMSGKSLSRIVVYHRHLEEKYL